MRLVLCPGHIYLRQKLTVNSSVSEPRLQSDSTIPTVKDPTFSLDFLATCRQLCEEGHQLYYSSNVFQIPIGSVDTAFEALKTMQSRDMAFNRQASLRLSLLDLTPAAYEEAEKDAKTLKTENRLTMFRDPLSMETAAYFVCFTEVLMEVGLLKIHGIKTILRGLETLTLEIRTQVDPVKNLRLNISAKDDIPSPESLLPSRPHNSSKKPGLHNRTALFLQFALQQACTKATLEILLHGWESFINGIDATFVEQYDNEIQGKAFWSQSSWKKCSEEVNAIAVSE